MALKRDTPTNSRGPPIAVRRTPPLKILGAGKRDSKFIFSVAKRIASDCATLDKSRSKIIRSEPI